jgi:hypothetical protein
MTTHLTDHDVERYVRRTLGGTTLLELAEHVDVCDDCRNRVAAAMGVGAATARVRSELDAQNDHPSDETLEAFVVGELDVAARDTVSRHLDVCLTCTEDVSDLEEAWADVRHIESRAEPSSLERHPSLLAAWSGRRLAAAAALVLVSVGAAWMALSWFRSPGTGGGPSAVSSSASIATAAVEKVALMDGGHRIALGADGLIRGLDAADEGDRALVARAMTEQSLSLPATLAELAPRAGALMGGAPAASAVRLLAPLGTGVDGQQPTFSWQASPEAKDYVVKVFDPARGKVAESAALRSVSWSPEQPLPRGRLYVWQVTVRTAAGSYLVPEPGTPEARFRILSDEESGALAAVRRRYAGQHLLLGLNFAKVGLLDEAERELRALAAENPSSPVAAGLVTQVERARAH